MNSTSLAIFCVILLALFACLKYFFKKSSSKLLSILAKRSSLLLLSLALMFFLLAFFIHEEPWVRYGIAILSLQGGLWISSFISYFTKGVSNTLQKKDQINKGMINLLHIFFQAIFCSFLGLFILENIGFEVTPLLTGLSIGGAAMALASQNILKDLFASVSIIINKPFEIGDKIRIKNLQGVVDHIGVHSTKLKSIEGEDIVFSNNELLHGPLVNLSKAQKTISEITLTFEELSPRIDQIIRDAASDTTLIKQLYISAFSKNKVTYTLKIIVNARGEKADALKTDFFKKLILQFKDEHIKVTAV